MKKIVALSLLIIYGSFSVGATLHLHYCMYEFVELNLWHSDNDSECGKCGMKDKKSGCCKDEHKQIKLSSDQNHPQAKVFLIQPFVGAVILTHHPVYNFSRPTVAVSFPKNNAPPLKRSVPIYIYNCVFLI